MKEKHKTYSQLTRDERYYAYQMRAEGLSIRKISKRLTRQASTISREFKRNLPVNPIVRRDLSPIGLSELAQKKAKNRSRIPRKKELLACDEELRKKVFKELENDQASPRDIRLRVKAECPGKSVSHTTIYRYIKKHRPELKEHFRLRGKPRRQRVTTRKKPENKSVIRRNISERTIFAKLRLEFGHFEVDTIVSPRGGSGFALLGIREMKSRMRWYSLVPNLKAETTLAAVRGFFSQLPLHMIKTLTADNGPENKDLYKLEELSPIKVYYCDPYCAHQRGGVENSNGEVRWYYPKGTDFKNVSKEELWQVTDKLNRRRMDCLGDRTSKEVFDEALKNPPRIILAKAESLSSIKDISELKFGKSHQHGGLFLPMY